MVTTLSDKINELSIYLGNYFEGILKGEISILNKEQKENFRDSLSSLFELVESEQNKEQQRKENLERIIRAVVEEFESYDSNIDELSLERDFRRNRKGATTVYGYIGNNEIALRKIETRIKSVYSLFKKMIIARLYDKKVYDIYGAIIVRDSPDSLKVDFEGIYAKKDSEQLKRIWKENCGVFGKTIPADDRFKTDFYKVFSEFIERYKGYFEEHNILAIESAGEFLQRESSRWRVIYTAPRHFLYQTFHLNMIKQDYIHPNPSRRIIGYISKYDQKQGAEKYLADKKEWCRYNKAISDYGKIRGDHWDSCFFYQKEGKSEILARKKDVVINLTGEKENTMFVKDSMEILTKIFSRFDLRENDAELIANGILASDKRWPGIEGLSSINFKLSPFELQSGWLETITEIDEPQMKKLKEMGLYHNPSKDPYLFCRNWVNHPKKNGFQAMIYRIDNHTEIQFQTSLMYFKQKAGDAAHREAYKDRIDDVIGTFLSESMVAKDSGFQKENRHRVFELMEFGKEIIIEEYKKRANYYHEQITASNIPIYFVNRFLYLYENFRTDFKGSIHHGELDEIKEKICSSRR